jgi:hypothetical protein
MRQSSCIRERCGRRHPQQRLFRSGRATTVLLASRLALASDVKQARGGAMPWAHVDGIEARLRAATSRAYALNLGSSNHPGARTIAGGRSR